MTRAEKRAIYIPSVTEKKFYEQYAQDIIKDSYQGSLKNFVCAFTAGHKLTSAEKDELLNYIKNSLEHTDCGNDFSDTL